MIYLAPDDEQEAVTEMTRSLGLDVLYPASKETEAAGAVPPAVWKTIVETGLTAPVSEGVRRRWRAGSRHPDGSGGKPGLRRCRHNAGGTVGRCAVAADLGTRHACAAVGLAGVRW